MNATNLDSSLSLEKITDAINIRIENGHIIPITSTALTDNYVKEKRLIMKLTLLNVYSKVKIKRHRLALTHPF